MKFSEFYIHLKWMGQFHPKQGYATKTTIFLQPYVAENQPFQNYLWDNRYKN